MTKFNICGVPEHFNLPWQMCLENGEFETANLDVKWTDVPEGSGKMCQMLRSGEVDVAIVLTEAILKDIANGNDAKIIQIYVESPLIWGIHVAHNSNYYHVADLKHKRIAISRKGSGSELMSIVHAKSQYWDTESLNFEIINTLHGAVEALASGVADYFMWEKFMTKPIVDSGIFRRIGECPTPWPCFVIAIRATFFHQHQNAVQSLLKVINEKTRVFKNLKSIENLIANRYQLKEMDVAQWISQTTWSQQNLSESEFDGIQSQLLNLQIIDKKGTFTEIVSTVKDSSDD